MTAGNSSHEKVEYLGFFVLSAAIGALGAKRKKIKVGMKCTFTYPGPGQEAKKVDCKG